MTPSIQSFWLQFGERGIKLNRLKNPIRRYVVAQFLIVAVVACFSAFGVYHFIAEVLPAQFYLSERHQDYWDQQVKSALEAFQGYVTLHDLSRQQAMEQSWWTNSDANVIIFFDPLPFLDPENPEHKSYLDENDLLELTCSDGNLFATSYSPGTAYRRKWKIEGMVSGTMCAVIILFSYVFHLLHRIKKLYRQILRSVQNECDAPISLRGQDELAELARNIEGMRCALLDLLEQEQESQKSQTQLIATLSHDIRTPLTKLMGYLDILRYQKVTTQEEQAHYLNLLDDKATQLKILTDDLLNCVFVKGKMIHDNREVVNGPEFLSQMLYEEYCELESRGFVVEVPTFEGDYTLNISIDAFQRICDNLFSNMIKYADKAHPICIHVTNRADFIHLSFSNYKADKNSDLPHHGLGLPSVREMMEDLGGTLSIIDTKEQFEVCIALPKTECYMKTGAPS